MDKKIKIDPVVLLLLSVLVVFIALLTGVVFLYHAVVLAITVIQPNVTSFILYLALGLFLVWVGIRIIIVLYKRSNR
jgi:hypothetical protein